MLPSTLDFVPSTLDQNPDSINKMDTGRRFWWSEFDSIALA